MKTSALIRIGTWGLTGSVIFALLPLMIALAAGAFGSALGCVIDESGTSVCMFLGADIGGILSTIGIIGWFSLITMPIGALTGILSLSILLISGMLHLWRKKKSL